MEKALALLLAHFTCFTDLVLTGATATLLLVLLGRTLAGALRLGSARA
jgi:hypothetical protein